jgi:exopolysaccharide production protein ExoQ
MGRRAHNPLPPGNASMDPSNTSKIHRGYSSASVHSGPIPHSEIGYVSSGGCSKFGKLYSVLEQLFVFLLLLSSMNVIAGLKPSSREQTEVKIFSADVDTSIVAIEAGVYAFGGVLVLLHSRRVLRAARTAWPLLALAVLACISTTWSVQPTVTLRRSLSLLAATILAVYIGERYSIKAFARLLAQTMCLMLMLVLVFYWVAPEYVVDHSAYGGAWKGLSRDKNTFGEHMAVAVLLLALVRFRRFYWVRYVFLLIAASLLLLSRSATALACGILGLAAVPLWRLMRGKQRLLAYLGLPLIFFLAVLCILAFPEPIFQIFGRDTTLTGRTHLWALLLPLIANHPILGYGYGAFWAGLNAEVLSVWIASQRLVPAADSGYIDLCLNLGAVGICLFLYVFIGAFRRAMEYVRSEPGFIGLWPITYLCIFAMDNICETALLTRGTFPFLVFAILTTSLAVNRQRVLNTTRTADSQPLMWEWGLPLSR